MYSIRQIKKLIKKKLIKFHWNFYAHRPLSTYKATDKQLNDRLELSF